LKRNVIISQERSLFEEYVKYQEFSHHFSLYSISNLKLKTSFQIENSNEIGSTATASQSPSITISGKSKTILTHGGTITLELIPLKTKYYHYVKFAFDYFKGKIKYHLFYYGFPVKASTENGDLSQDIMKKCHFQSLYCVPIDGLTNSKGQEAWAYLTKRNIAKFRQLEESFSIKLPQTKNPGDRPGPVYLQ
jgi:hypothetical protein